MPRLSWIPPQCIDYGSAGPTTGGAAADQTLYARHVTVRADSGVVTLDGYVWTPVEIDESRKDTEKVSGVAKVVNRIEVDRGAINNSSVAR